MADEPRSLDDVLKEIFGEPIYSYTDADAIADGVLIPLIREKRDTGHRITRTAFDTLSEYYLNHGYSSYREPDFYRFFFAELLPLVTAARSEYRRGGILMTNYDFKVIRQGDDVLWYLPNENDGLTMMLPTDY